MNRLAKAIEPTGAWGGTSVEQVSEYHKQVTLNAASRGTSRREIGRGSAGKGTQVAEDHNRRRGNIAIHLRDVKQPAETKELARWESADVTSETTKGRSSTPALSQREREQKEPRR